MSKLILSFLVLAAVGSSALAQPVLRVLDSEWDFGTTPQHSTVLHYFWFRSMGTDTVRINDIKTGCTCALMPLERDWIAPGDSLRVGIIWQTKRAIGAWNRYPRVFSNASEEPLKLVVEGSVVKSMEPARPVSLKPYKLEMARTSNLSLDSMSFGLTNHSSLDLSVKIVSSAMEQVELVLPEIVKAGAEATGWIKVKPEFMDVEFTTSVTMQFSNQEETRITLPVRRKFYLSKAD